MSGPTIADIPVQGEPPALDLVNTTFVKGGTRGRLLDVLVTPEQLVDWLGAHAETLGPGLTRDLARTAPADADVLRFRELRGALRQLLTTLLDGSDWPPEAVRRVNHAARTAASWTQLPAAPTGTAHEVWSVPDPAGAALSRVAASGITLLTGPDRDALRACRAPGCVLFFVKQHQRREWCSTECGTRARVARHARKKRAGEG
ncbi:CGNR zinc finger domain-containing protein [Streptomyces sp. HNM0574]|uniref:CGNR zinc finger domain-containing protein n=1 Tax=Streptomyces sp. HNM0574 TaxID=2714954 RepID=UPI00146AD632|nr:CGNR zinc finger domain-containing protein [Streptomyces sp. HNM0574]NLU70883.1 hypothetical protein [Streptomyces sp. HNM0574]